MKKRWKVLGIVLVALLAAGAAVWYLGGILRRNARDRLVSGVQRYSVSRGTLSLTAVGSGKIVSSDVTTLVPSGTLREIKVQVGDTVKKGGVLATVLGVTGAEQDFTTDTAGVVTAIPGSAAALSSSSPTAQSASSGFEISNPDKLQMDIQATEQDVYKIHTGQKASVYIDAPGVTMDGSVTRVSHSGNTAGDFTTYDVTVSLPKPSADIYLGMTGSAKITVETRKDVVKVPVDAVIERGDKRYVLNASWLDHPDKPESDYYLAVKTGLSDADYVEILSDLPARQILILPSGSTGGLGFGNRSSES